MPTYDLGLEHVSLAFATKTIFTDVTQGVFEGDRIGIVGKNGDGKSTLLHLFKGTQEPDSGRVTMRNGLTFGMLDQRDPLDDNATVREAALEGREDYEWAAETRSREIVEALLGGISLDAKIGSLSGGQRRRADLARLLLKDWDILALDEPTNHLDVVTIHWLAEHLKNRWPSGQGALLLVTLLIYLILRKVTGALQEGVEFAERVASGDLDRSLNIRREDELGKLARALNTMVQRLKASFSIAEERAREAEEASARATETSQELEAVINGVRGGVARLELTDNLRVLWANAGFYALAGRSHAEYEQDVHDEALLVVHPDDRAHLLGAFRSSLASNIPVHTEYRILRRDGGVVWIYLQASLVGHRDGVPVFQGVFVDVSKQKNTMRALELEQQRNRIVAELTNDIIFEYDYDTDEMTCSERYETIFHKPRVIPDYRRHQDNLLNMLLPEDAKTLQEAYRRIEQGVDSYALTLRLLQPEAGYQWYSIRFRSIRDETGRTIKLIGQLTNIHHQKLEEDRLRHEASTDLLTQIYNKITTEHLVSLELQEGRNHALIVVDLDKFKYANDTFGHLFGDSVIKAVAATLRATFRATDIVGRTGGDEFVVLAKDISLSDGLETLKAKCRRLSVELAHVSLGQDYVISASIGISLFPRDGKTYAELFAKADAALYQIKNTGRGHFAVYGEVPETETKALPSGGKGMPLMPQGPRNDA